MAYRLTYAGKALFDPYTDDTVAEAKLTNNLNNPSYLDFDMAPGHALYGDVEERAGLVELFWDGEELFAGQVASIETDMQGTKTVSCEGVMAWLGDTVVRPYSTVAGEQGLTAPSSVDGLLQWYVDQHNAHTLDPSKHFSVGVNQGACLDANNYIYRASSQLPATLDEVREKIVDSLGGYLEARREGGTNYLDLYADVHEANAQVVDFGVNITDFAEASDSADQYTAVRPSGATPEPEDGSSDEDRKPITISGLPDGTTEYDSDVMKRGDVVYSESAVARYGYREEAWSNTDCTTEKGLLRSAVAHLNKVAEPKLTVTVKAVDLSLFMDGYDHLRVGQAVRVRSAPHGVDEYLTVNSIALDLQDPGQSEYVLGEAYDTLTGRQSGYIKSLNSGINKSLDAVDALDQATKDAAMSAEDAQKRADEADKKAQGAQDSADKAQSKADGAQSKADQADKKADDAQTSADKAQGSADKAQEKADAADSKADKAQESADAAGKKADGAQSAADAARAAADKAQKELDQATARLDQAVSDMNGHLAESDGLVDKAQKAADAAQSAADKAQASADANANDIAAVESKADAAKDAAAEAQSKAENVASDLSSTKATVEQHTTELGELATKVTKATSDASSALTASTEAKQTATEATTKAESAYKDSQTALTASTTATQTATKAQATAESAAETASDSLKQASQATQTANELSAKLTTEYQTKADADKVYATQASLKATSESITSEVSKTYATKSAVDALQNIADNAIESWRGTGVPTADNKPASDWATAALKKQHNGDLYYDKSTGKAYRWGSDDGEEYTWELNQDSDVTKALQDASKAQSTANGATTAASKAQSTADSATTKANAAQSAADTAKGAADNAATAASKAQGDVDKLKVDIPATYATKSSVEQTAESITASVTKAQRTADSAVTAASTAQQTADSISATLTKDYQTASAADAKYATQTDLKATSDGLTASVTKAQSTADGAVTAASKAQQTADAVTLNLSKNYTSTADADKKFATKAEVTASADSITTSVSKTYATKEALSSTDSNVSKAQSTASSAATAAKNAQSTADAAKTSAASASSAASKAQSAADAAKANAKKAQDDVDALKNRVTTAETSIKQNSDAIALRATKTDLYKLSAGDNLWQNQYFSNNGPLIAGIVAGVNDPSGGNVGLCQGRDHFNAAVKIPVANGHTYRVACTVKDASGNGYFAVNKNARMPRLGFWITEGKGPGYNTPYNSPTTVTELDDGWLDYSLDFAWNHLEDRGVSPFIQIETNSSGGYPEGFLKYYIGNLRVYDITDEITSKTYTDAQLKVTSESITSTVSKSYATKTELSTTNSNVTAAKNAADSAATAASKAQSTADSATTAASKAQSTADSAASTASTAKSTADTAKSTADTASKTASTAKSTADTAASNASSALTKANTAASDASTAKTDAASAKTTANTANTTANTAKSTADAVKDDLAANYSTTVEMNSAIEQTAESIKSMVSTTYVSSAAAAEFAKKSELEQTSSSLKASISTTQTALDSMAKTTKNVEDYMTFEAGPKLTIGTSSSTFKTVITNTGEQFVNAGQTVMELDGTTSTVKANRLQTGLYRWQASPDGAGIQLVYVGG